MDTQTAASHLQQARSAIRQAMAGWNPADLDRVETSKDLLVSAVGDLRLFESAVRAGYVPPTEQLFATVLAVKKEIAQATRVVDACVAFHRGLVARTGEAPPVYDAEGHLTSESAGLEPEVHA